jgi:hypothetical protein
MARFGLPRFRKRPQTEGSGIAVAFGHRPNVPPSNTSATGRIVQPDDELIHLHCLVSAGYFLSVAKPPLTSVDRSQPWQKVVCLRRKR